MIPSDVLGRIFCLRIGNQTATGFVIDVDAKQYLITAKHFGTRLNLDGPLQGLFEKQWHVLEVQLVGHAAGEIDISVFALGALIAKPELKLIPDQAIIYGQDVYFLGFPHGWWGDSRSAFVGRPLPFVRKAVVSCVEDGPNGEHRNFLAGHNVMGFSGGPVVYSFNPPLEFRVTSVVSGYKFVESPIFANGILTDATFKENTGIIVTYGIRHAVDLIHQNPIGFPL